MPRIIDCAVNEPIVLPDSYLLLQAIFKLWTSDPQELAINILKAEIVQSKVDLEPKKIEDWYVNFRSDVNLVINSSRLKKIPCCIMRVFCERCVRTYVFA